MSFFRHGYHKTFRKVCRLQEGTRVAFCSTVQFGEKKTLILKPLWLDCYGCNLNYIILLIKTDRIMPKDLTYIVGGLSEILCQNFC